MGVKENRFCTQIIRKTSQVGIIPAIYLAVDVDNIYIYIILTA